MHIYLVFLNVFTGCAGLMLLLLEYYFVKFILLLINLIFCVVQGAVITAEIVSCLKRTLARMLVIIASLGFGITKYVTMTTVVKSLVIFLFVFV